MSPHVAGGKIITLWDLPVRITHWAFVLLLPAMWWTAEEGHLEWHQRFGFLFLGLLVFRILWGFVGNSTARFSQFLKGPTAVLAYVRGKTADRTVLGHNPVGGWSVAALLGLIALQIGLGLIAQDDDALFAGPLNHLVSYDTGDAARELHELMFNILLALVAVHVAAILFYLLVKKDNLIVPMLSGHKSVDGATTNEPRRGSKVAFLLSAAGAAALVTWVWFGAPPLGQ